MGIKVKWVNPKDYPEFGPETAAFCEGSTIYMFKGRLGERKPYVQRHEEAHVRLGHTLVKGKSTPLRFVEQELDADLVANIAEGAPTSYLGDIKGIYFGLREDYGLTPSASVRLIERVMKRRVVPKKWWIAFKRLKTDVSKTRR